jgi:NitT/TauT family transport system substrate-binding protein
MLHTSRQFRTNRGRLGGAAAVTVLALVVSTALAACGASEDTASGSEGQLERVTVQLQLPENGIFTPFWFGKSKGIYADHGIDLEIEPGVSSQAATDAVARGSVDFTTSSFPSVVLNQASGNSVVGLAELIRGGNQGLLVGADTGITSWKDLPGKSVIITTGSSQKPLYDAALAASGVDPEDVKVVNVNQAVINQTFSNGGADAVLTLFPFSEPIVSQKRKTKALSFSDAGVEMPGFFIVSSDGFVKKNKDLSQRFVDATLESWAEAYQEPGEAVAAMLKSNPALNKDDAEATFEAFAAVGCGVDDNGTWFGDYSEPELNGGLSVLLDSGLVKKDSVDLASVFPRSVVDGIPVSGQRECSTLVSGS